MKYKSDKDRFHIVIYDKRGTGWKYDEGNDGPFDMADAIYIGYDAVEKGAWVDVVVGEIKFMKPEQIVSVHIEKVR